MEDNKASAPDNKVVKSAPFRPPGSILKKSLSKTFTLEEKLACMDKALGILSARLDKLSSEISDIYVDEEATETDEEWVPTLYTPSWSSNAYPRRTQLEIERMIHPILMARSPSLPIPREEKGTDRPALSPIDIFP